MNIKPKVIKFLNPIRRFFSEIYSFVLAAYLGKIVIALNQIDHFIIDWIFNFFVLRTLKEDIKKNHQLVFSQTMGKKLIWLKQIYNGDLLKVQKDLASLIFVADSAKLVKNNTFNKIITLLEKITQDVRNPLIHSSYFLGYGNEYEWKLSYHRFYFNKIKKDFDNSPFTIKEARGYLREIQTTQKELNKMYFQLLNEMFPM